MATEATCAVNLMKFGPVAPEICVQTDKHTVDIHTHTHIHTKPIALPKPLKWSYVARVWWGNIPT